MPVARPPRRRRRALPRAPLARVGRRDRRARAATDRDRRATPTLLTPRRVTTHRTTRHGINRTRRDRLAHSSTLANAIAQPPATPRDFSAKVTLRGASTDVDAPRSSPHTRRAPTTPRARARAATARENARAESTATMATLARDDARARATRGNILGGDECEGTPSGWDGARGLWAREPARAGGEGAGERAREERRARGAGADGGAGDDDVRVRGGVVGFAIERALARESGGGGRRRARRIASAGAGRDARAGRTR